MLKHSMFSNFYLGKKINSEASCMQAKCHGSLALSPQDHNEKRVIFSRGASRTWWESAWQARR
ncbi:MAG: hypothetical protein PHD82_08645 [Candidatus Riflebacteria bacterium]|nr:hypothetical protein [Candidatus Riflebacteria bacterium]